MFIGLASFAMRGPVQAGLIAATTLMLAILLPPLAWLSGALPALVVLRLGPLAGLRVVAIGLAAATGFALLAMGQAVQVFAVAAMFWLPAGLLAALLRRSIRLDLAMLAATVAALLLVLIIFASSADPVGFWRDALTQILGAADIAAQTGVDAADLQALVDAVAQLMTGALAATLLLSTLFSLLLARSWQAALYNPGGFGTEFRSLRLGRVAALLATLICALAFATRGHLLVNLAAVVLTLYLFQGLALVHGVIAIRRMAAGWLFALYGLLLFLMPQMMLLLGALGMVDAWIDLRARMAPGGDGAV